jgi:hypothetical protein
MASTAVQTITEVVRRVRNGESPPHIHHRMECSLVARGSTSSPITH